MGVDLVQTREAARLYGVTYTGLRRAMREAGIQPEVRPREGGRGGGSHWWNPLEVLRVRAERAERLRQAILAFICVSKNPTQRRGRQLVARNTLLERNRNKRLAPIAAERGMTVKELRIDLGIDKR